MRRRSWVVLVALLAAVAAALIFWILPRTRDRETAYRTESVQRGDVRVQVSATGTLNPVTTVQVGSQISGTVSALYADFNSQVKAGQVIAQIDPTFLRAQAAQNEADLERAQVTLRQAERDYARQAPLREQGLASQAEIDAAETALDAARAGVKSAEAALLRARTNLEYATITSPIDGTVVSRDVDIGQTVAASLSAPTLFTIARDLKKMQLEAAVDEADIGLIEIDQRVEFTVDAFPDRTFQGIVDQVRLSPTTDQNVVTYTVIVEVDNPEQRLLPGMTANATFVVDEARDVLRVPVSALRFRPPSEGDERRGRPAGGAAFADPSGGDVSRARTGSAGAGSRAPGSAGVRREGDGPAESGRGDGGDRARLFVLEGENRLRRIAVRQGLNDGTFVEVASDSLREGMQVVVGLAGGQNAQSQTGSGTVNPFAPSPRGARRGGR